MDESTRPPHGPDSGTPAGQSPGEPVEAKWQALRNAASVVAGLAGRADTTGPLFWSDLPRHLQGANEWSRRIAEQGIEDLTVIMETGISALIAVEAAGIDSRAAAQGLWDEYRIAVEGLMRLVPEAPLEACA